MLEQLSRAHQPRTLIGKSERDDAFGIGSHTTQAYQPMHRTEYGNNALPLVRPDDFADVWFDGFRQVRSTLTDLDRQEARLLDDLARLRGCKMLRRGFEIIRAKSQCPVGASALPELLGVFLLASQRTDHTIEEAFGLETSANQALDDAQFSHVFRPSRGAIDAVIEKASGQKIASQLLRDTMARHRPKLVAVR